MTTLSAVNSGDKPLLRRARSGKLGGQARGEEIGCPKRAMKNPLLEKLFWVEIPL
jgi:hypothetical protein